MTSNLDIIIVAGFLTVNLIFGLLSGRGIKNTQQYSLGNRNFSTATIVATIAATWIGGSNFSITIAETHKQGVFFLLCSLAEAVSFGLIAYFYAPRMAEFLGKLSIAEAMHSIYKNNYIRAIIAIFSTIPGLGRVAMQFLVMQALLNLWLGIPGVYATAISSLIVIIYSSFGGIKAVTFTDLIQFFAFGVVIPMTAFLIWKSFSNNDMIVSTLMSDPLFNYNLISDSQKQGMSSTLYLSLFLMVPLLDPAIFQRISMAKNTLQVSKSFLIAIFFILICDALVHTVIGVLFRADTNIIDLTADNVMQYVVGHYLSYGFKGIFIIGIMAMIMSTADSYINSSAILLGYDLPKSLGIKFTEQSQLRLIRFSSLFIGLASLLVSLFAKNLLDLLLSVYSFYMPIVTLPFTLAIFGFRSTAKALLIGMAAGFVTVVYFELFSAKYNIISGIPGTLVSFIFFIGSHYILGAKGGWVGIKDQEPLNALRLARKRKFYSFIQSVKNFSLAKSCQNNTPKEDRIFVYFGLFCIVVVFSYAYSLSRDIQQEYAVMLNFIYYSALTLSTIFITYPFWSEKYRSKVFISVLWNIAVFYNLAFSSSLLVVIGQFNQIQITILMASLITLAVLMRWQVAILMIIGGVVASIQCYKVYRGIGVLPEYMEGLQFKITYSLLLLSGILIAFFKPKQQYQELTEENNLFLSSKVGDQKKELARLHELKNEFLRNLEHEAHTPITGITSMGQVLWEKYDKFTENQRRQATQEIAKSSERLTSLVNNLIDLSKLENINYKLNKTAVNLTNLVYKRLEICRKLYTEEKNKENQNFDLNIEGKLFVSCDEYYIARTIDNIIINAIQYCKKGTIAITLKSTNENNVEFSVKDEGIGIPKEELLDIFDPFTVSSKTKTPSGGRGIGLTLCKKVVTAHNGEITATGVKDKGSIFRVTLPKK